MWTPPAPAAATPLVTWCCSTSGWSCGPPWRRCRAARTRKTSPRKPLSSPGSGWAGSAARRRSARGSSPSPGERRSTGADRGGGGGRRPRNLTKHSATRSRAPSQSGPIQRPRRWRVTSRAARRRPSPPSRQNCATRFCSPRPASTHTNPSATCWASLWVRSSGALPRPVAWSAHRCSRTAAHHDDRSTHI